MVHKDEKQETFALVVTRTKPTEIRDALGLRGLYLKALGRKKAKIARSKDVDDEGGARGMQNERSRSMYMEIVKVME